jgi:hypothetical protein
MCLIPFVASAQTIKSISPSSATQVESISCSIVSENTTFKTGENIVKLIDPNDTFHYLIPTSVVVVNDTLLNVCFTFRTKDKICEYDLVISNSQTSTPIVLQKAFSLNSYITQIPPVLLSVSPAVATQNDTVEITVKSKNTHFTQPFPTYVSLLNATHEISALSPTTVIDDTTIKTKFVLQYFDKAGVYDVSISNFIDGQVKLVQSFTVNQGPFPPTLLNVSPNKCNRLDSVLVTIKGKNTFFKRDSCNVALVKNFQYYILGKKITYLTDTTMTAFFSFENGTEANQFDIRVFNSFNIEQLILPGAFTLHDTLLPPLLLSFSPISAIQGDSIKIIVKGKNTHFLHPWTNLAVAKNSLGIWPIKTKVINDSIIEGSFYTDYYTPDPGSYNIFISNPIDGILVATDSFKLKKGNDPPRILSISPTSGIQGQKVDVLIKAGKNTRFRSMQLSPQLNNGQKKVYPRTLSIVNDSNLLASFELSTDSMLTGVYDVNTSWPTSEKNLPLPAVFTIYKNPAPASLTSLSPAAATQFDTVSIMIKASRSHFLSEWLNVRLIAADNPNYSINCPLQDVVPINDSLLKASFIFYENYYSSAVYHLEVISALDGTIQLKNAFIINRIYDKYPQITDIFPKDAMLGQSVTIDIKGPKGTFLPGVNNVKLFNYLGPVVYSILPTSVNCINDSLVTASFTFDSLEKTGTYYLQVKNKSNLIYYDGFNLKQIPASIKLIAVTPSWASQTDTATLAITGYNTHFSSTDDVWLENKFSTKIKPFQLNVINDTLTTAKFAFNKTNPPVGYSVHVKSVGTNTTLILKDAFTVTGGLNVTSLIDVYPRAIGCYFNNIKSKIKVYGIRTHFLTEADTLLIVGQDWYQTVVYPDEMEILNDSTISAVFTMGNVCGALDIYVLGKENCILVGKLVASPPVSVDGKQKEPFKIFPNPSEGIFTLELNEDFEQTDVIVVDVLGKTVFSGKKLQASTQIDLSDYPAGMYFIKLVKDDRCKTEKIIKQ